MMGLKVSVIIPVYNDEESIDRCLLSVVSQTYSDMQIIIVDDGSTDSTRRKCRLYASEYSNIEIIYQSNEGVSSARNKGLRHVKGEYFTFLDSDDWYDIDYVEACIDEAKKSSYPNLIFTPYIREYKKKSVANNFFNTNKVVYFDKNEFKQKLYRRLYGPINEELYNPGSINDFSPVWGKFYKSSLCKKVKFQSIAEIGSEDLWFNVNIFSNMENALYVGNAFYHYNKINKKSLTHKSKMFLFQAWENLFKLMQQNIVDENLNNLFQVGLNNRIAILSFEIIREIINSSNSYYKKKKLMDDLINTKIFLINLQKIDIRYFRIDWKIFFFLIKRKIFFAVFLIINVAEPLKKYLK